MTAYPQALTRSAANLARGRGRTAESHRRTTIRLWLPLTLVFLLLAPFALLLSPLLYLVPKPWAASPLGTVARVGAVLLSCGGAAVAIETRHALVHIRIF